MSSITETKGGILYEMINLINGKGYAGKDSNPKLVDGVWKARRPAAHISAALRSSNDSPLLNNAIRKNLRTHGRHMFLVINHPDWHPNDVLNDEEKKLIRVRKYFTDRSKGYNLTAGGDGLCGHMHSKETRDKMSAWQSANRDANVDLAMAMLADGENQSVVAEAFEVSIGTIQNWIRWNNSQKHRARIASNRFTQFRAENIDRVMAMLADGKTAKVVSEILGVPCGTITGWKRWYIKSIENQNVSYNAP